MGIFFIMKILSWNMRRLGNASTRAIIKRDIGGVGDIAGIKVVHSRSFYSELNLRIG